MAILNNLAVTVSCLSCSAHCNNELLSSQAKVWDPDTFDKTDPKKLEPDTSPISVTKRRSRPKLALQLLPHPETWTPPQVLLLRQKKSKQPLDSAQPGSCIDSGSAPMEARLNMSALSDPNALKPLVSILPYNLENIRALVDSGSTHCFVDLHFMLKNKHTTRTISLVTFRLFDGSLNFVIAQAVALSILFPATGDVTPMNFYLAPLASECKIVLGHNWLTCFNLLIDWVLSSIEFRTFAGGLPAPLSTPSLDLPRKPVPGLPDWSDPSLVPSVDVLVCTPPHLSLVNAVAFAHTCKLEGSVKYQLQLRPSGEVKGRLSSTSPAPDLSSVPPEYCDYADVFSKANVKSNVTRQGIEP